MKKKDYRNIIVLLLITIIIILITKGNNLYASTMDYLNQHAIFPEYLRQTFYNTHELIPKFSFNLGSGINIYDIAYYGLLNPIIILSYLLPQISMINYLIASNIILLMLSIVLMYKWLKEKHDTKETFLLTLLFLTTGSLIFQFHRQFMFVSYMPFLILSLISIDHKKENQLMISILLMILTSFYYSVGGILVIIIYYIYTQGLKDIKVFIKNLIIPVLTSSILLLPTLNTIVTSRTSSNINIINLIIPKINPDTVLYGAYSPGLTSILILSLIYLLMKNKKNKILSLILILPIIFPIFINLLNGGLYARGKALIPFIPLYIYVIGIFIKDLFNNKIDIKKLLTIVIIVNIITLINYQTLLYYLDIFFMLILLIVYNKIKIKNIIIIPLILMNLVICTLVNKEETYINKSFLSNINKEYKVDNKYSRTINLCDNYYTVNKIYDENYLTTSIYSSVNNKYYTNLVYNEFKLNQSSNNNLIISTTPNILFNMYMGVNKVISNNPLQYPYKYQNNNIYSLDFSYPLGYATSYLMNQNYYNTLDYPYNVEALLNNIITPSSNNTTSNTNIKESLLEYTYELPNNIIIDNNKIEVKEDSKLVIKLKENMNKEILFLNLYGLKSNEEDISITINNQTNTLSKLNWIYPNNNNIFHYVLSGVEDNIVMEFKKGIYYIDDIKLYTLNISNIESIYKSLDKLNIEEMTTNTIKGNIDVTSSGYFTIQIPYDKGFKIMVDNKETKYELVNNAFLGFPIEKGTHNITITYNPPLLKEGKILSLIGLLLFILNLIIKKRIR